MPLINNRQTPAKCFESSKHLISKIKKSGVGAVIVYSDGLYMFSDEPAADLKVKFQKLIEEHKRGYLNYISKDVNIIPSAFSFFTWSQLILNCREFHNYFKEFKQLYKKDKKLQSYLLLDIESAGKKVNNNTINYVLEEVLLDYLVVKGMVQLPNEFIQNHQKWILNCYHGKPHRTNAYIHQKDLFGFKSKNPYQNAWYDLSAKKLYEFDRIDIDSFNFHE